MQTWFKKRSKIRANTCSNMDSVKVKVAASLSLSMYSKGMIGKSVRDLSRRNKLFMQPFLSHKQHRSRIAIQNRPRSGFLFLCALYCEFDCKFFNLPRPKPGNCFYLLLNGRKQFRLCFSWMSAVKRLWLHNFQVASGFYAIIRFLSSF